MAGIAVLFQTVPAFFSEMFAVLTVFSALPLYFMCRLDSLAGINTFIAAAILIFIISPHEGILFIFTNGILGLSLGLCKKNIKDSFLTIIISSFILTASLCILSIPLGINVFFVHMPYGSFLQAITISIFCVIYCAIYSKLASYLFHRAFRFCKRKHLKIF